jgi:hypothetical protein
LQLLVKSIAFLHVFQKAATSPQKTNQPSPQEQKQPVPNPKVSFKAIVFINGTESAGNKGGMSKRDFF